MSAWLCSDDHVRLLALTATEQQLGGALRHDLEKAQTYANELRAENNDSLGVRYGDEPAPIVQVGAQDIHRLNGWLHDPVAIIKSAHCFEYQACEHDGWRSSDACLHILPAAIKRASNRLPGYADAPWGIDGPKPTPKRDGLDVALEWESHGS